MSKRVAIKETYDLPSGGKIYGENFPSSVTLRAMTTLDEKARLAGTGMESMVNLIQNCIEKPDNLNVSDLVLPDMQFLMYKLRTVTYGSDYQITLRCPNCGNQHEFVVNLDDLSVDLPFEDFTGGTFDIGPLPVSGDVIQARLLSVGEYDKIEREAKRIKSKNPQYVGDPEFILTYRYKIVSINNDINVPSLIQEYVENMNARDLRYFDSRYEKYEDFGLNLDLTQTCSICGKDYDYRLPVTSEFFRPTY